MKPLVCLVLILLTPISISADCGQFFRYGYRQNYIVQPYVQQQVVHAQVLHPVYYQVGYSVQREALQQQQIRNDPEYIKWLRFKAFEAGYDSAQEQLKANSPPDNPSIPNPQTSALAQHCAKCHGSNLTSPKGEVFIDPTVAMSGDLITKSLKRLALPNDDPNRMPPPPDNPLDDKAKGQLMQELLSLFQPVPPGESK